MNPAMWRWMKLLAGALILAALAWRLGVGPFLDGIAKVDGRALLAATVLTMFTTVCSAWRWRLVARSLGLELSLRSAILAYYRSQFLNTVLPGGVLGDVHRGVVHGQDSGDVGRGLRAVAWERIGGQLVQLGVAVILLALLPSPVRSSMPLLAAAAAAMAAAAVVVFRALPAAGTASWPRAIRISVADVRGGLLASRTWHGVVVASAAAMAGHTGIFLIAARTAGPVASAVQMLPLAVLVLLAMSVPTNIAGWGPREGAAAWAFSAAGLGAGQGVTVAVVYGVMVFVACLPGAAVLVMGWLHPGRRAAGLAEALPALPPAAVRESGPRG